MHTGDMAHWELALETTTVCPLGSNESHPSHLQKTLTVRDPQSLIHERDSSGLDSRPKASTSTSSPLQRRALGCGCLGMLPLDLRICEQKRHVVFLPKLNTQQGGQHRSTAMDTLIQKGWESCTEQFCNQASSFIRVWSCSLGVVVCGSRLHTLNYPSFSRRNGQCLQPNALLGLLPAHKKGLFIWNCLCPFQSKLKKFF